MWQARAEVLAERLALEESRLLALAAPEGLPDDDSGPGDGRGPETVYGTITPVVAPLGCIRRGRPAGRPGGGGALDVTGHRCGLDLVDPVGGSGLTHLPGVNESLMGIVRSRCGERQDVPLVVTVGEIRDDFADETACPHPDVIPDLGWPVCGHLLPVHV
jgi:hypothetical protein